MATVTWPKSDGLGSGAARLDARHALRYIDTPGLLPPKTDVEIRPMKGLAIRMILLVTAQELRKAVLSRMQWYCWQRLQEMV